MTPKNTKLILLMPWLHRKEKYFSEDKSSYDLPIKKMERRVKVPGKTKQEPKNSSKKKIMTTVERKYH